MRTANDAREVYFYRELAAKLPVARPRCHWAEIAGAGPEFALILEDMAPAEPGDQLAGCSSAVARAAVCELAKLHGPSWMNPAMRGRPWIAEPSADVAYFLGASLLPEVRRSVERELVRAYRDALCAQSVRGYALEQCWQDYRRGVFAGFAVTVVASVLVQETPRGNDMFTAMARRHARHALDLDAAELLA